MQVLREAVEKTEKVSPRDSIEYAGSYRFDGQQLLHLVFAPGAPVEHQRLQCEGRNPAALHPHLQARLGRHVSSTMTCRARAPRTRAQTEATTSV